MQSPSNGSVPNPDPTERTVEQLLREIATSREIVEAKANGNREVVETRLAGMDTAIELLQEASDKIPQFIKDQVAQLQQLHEEKFISVSALVATRFDSIGTQFAERDKRTEQLSLSDKTAIAAALQAQKEAAGAQNESNTTANTKMEANFAKLIDQTQTLLQAVTRNTDDKINDLKSRLDKGEGRTSVSDPEVAEGIRQLRATMADLAKSRDTGAGYGAGQAGLWGLIVGGLGLLFGLGSFVVMMLKFVK